MNGQLGFLFKKGKITAIVKDSSAARNGLLTDHQICEINGQNIIGLKVKTAFGFAFPVFLLLLVQRMNKTLHCNTDR